MKHITSLILAVTLVTGSLFASEVVVQQEEESSWSYEVSTRVWSQYHAASDFGGSGAIYLDKPVFQTDISATWKDITFGLWHSAGLNDANLSGDYGDELDYYLSYEREVGGFDASLYVAYFDTIDIFRTPGDSISISPKVAKSFEVGSSSVTPFIQWTAYVPVGDGALAGNLFQIGTEHEFSLGSYDICHGVSFAYDDGAFGLEQGYIFNYLFTGSVSLSEKVTLEIPMVKFSTPLSDVDDGRGTEATFGIGLLFSF